MLKDELTGIKDKISSDNTIIVAPFSTDEIGRELHPSFKFSYKSIVGELYSLQNGMRYLNANKFNIKYLNRPLDKTIYNEIFKGGFKTVPNYWEIVKLLTIDRILADKDLVYKLYLNLTELNFFVFKPKIVLKKGIISETVDNDKLFIYGKILNNLVKTIITELKNYKVYDDDLTIENLRTSISKKDYKEFKTKVKSIVFTDAIAKSEGNIVANVADVDNNELKTIFL